MKKLFSFVLILFLIFSFGFFSVLADGNHAKASVVMDVNTKRILYSHNKDIKLPMASTTKIMTALVAIENGNLDDLVTISKKASLEEGSSIYLKEGERIRLEDLLYGLMLRSGNDAALAIAEHFNNKGKDFYKMMNEKAKKIGAENTNFENPHGLPCDNHYSTAYDLGLITCHALKNKKFAEIVKTQSKEIPGPPGVSWVRALQNKNKMLWQFSGGDGVKTGYTKKAGRCLVSSATRNNWQLVAVVLNCGDWWNYSSKLLDTAFNDYENVKIIDKDKINFTIDVSMGKEKVVKVKPTNDFFAPLLKMNGEYEKVTCIPALPNLVKAPIKRNENSGFIDLYIGNNLLGRVNLVYKDDIESSNILYNLKKVIRSLF